MYRKTYTNRIQQKEMNQSLSQNEWNKREKQFLKDYLKWCKSNKKLPAPIYPPELNDSNQGDNYWEYKKGEELILDAKKRKSNKDEIIKKITDYYKNKKLDKIKKGELWPGFD